MDINCLSFSYLELEMDTLYLVLDGLYANEKKYILKKGPFKMSLPIRQATGGRYFPKVVFFIPKCCKNKTIMISNYADGWMTLGNKISNESSTFHYNFRLSKNVNENFINSLMYWNSGKNQRVIYTMKDPKWMFYEQGDTLWFEELENYQKRLIKDRLNFEILVSYCKKLGINILDNDFFNSEENAIYLEQISW